MRNVRLVHCTEHEKSMKEGKKETMVFCCLFGRDRVSCVWQTVRDHLCHLCVHATENCFLVERAVVGLLRLAIRLLRREDISSQVPKQSASDRAMVYMATQLVIHVYWKHL